MKYLKYLWYVVRHKWYVFLECKKSHLTWLGIIHDWSKLRPSEFFPYANHFYGKGKDISTGRDKTGYYKPTDTGDPAFDLAWFYHQKRNKHHWQYWITPEDRTPVFGEKSGLKILTMPSKYRREMVCDWKGASRAQGKGRNIFDWWEANNHKMQLHPTTREILERFTIEQEKVSKIVEEVIEEENT